MMKMITAVAVAVTEATTPGTKNTANNNTYITT
jgi:hypothetical protein